MNGKWKKSGRILTVVLTVRTWDWSRHGRIKLAALPERTVDIMLTTAFHPGGGGAVSPLLSRRRAGQQP